MGKPLHLGLALSRQLLLVKHRLRLLDYEWDHYPHLSLHTKMRTHTHTHRHTHFVLGWKVAQASCEKVLQEKKKTVLYLGTGFIIGSFSISPTHSLYAAALFYYNLQNISSISPLRKADSFIKASHQTHVANQYSSYLCSFLTIQVGYLPPFAASPSLYLEEYKARF